VARLTRAELRTLHDVLAGVQVEEAAARDWVTVNTVKFHRLNMYRKIGLPGGQRQHTRERIAERARELGLAA
jgi:DNA-binding CsgD family transcriptional regulator